MRRFLLDEPFTLELPRRASVLRALVQHGYWRVTTYRHSPLPDPERRLDVVIGLRSPRPLSEWEQGPLDSIRGPGVGRDGELEVKPGRRGVKWPHEPKIVEMRRALLLPSAARVRQKLRVPPRARLTFELGLVPSRGGRRPVRFTVRIRRSGSKSSRRLMSFTLGAEQKGQWLPVTVSLAEWARSDVVLELGVETVGGPRHSAMGTVALARPALVYPSPERKPNVLLVILDTARASSLGCYGSRLVRTPRIDRLARQSTLFERAYTNGSWTRPAMMTMFSSRYPGLAGATPGYYFPLSWARQRIERGEAGPTLGSHLAAEGYLTRVIGSNFVLLPHSVLGLDFGITSFAHVMQRSAERENDAITRRATAFLQRNRRHRFFLHVHYMSAHAPYDPPVDVLRGLMRRAGQAGEKPSPRQLYLAAVMALDVQVGRLLDTLECEGLADDTVVVLTSDHGEILDPHHCFELPKLHHDTCYHHSGALYDEVLRVPLLVRGPRVLAGRRIEQRYSHIDLAPTLLDLLRLPRLPGAQGISLHGHLEGRLPAQPREVYSVARLQVSLIKGRHKLIWRFQKARVVRRNSRTRECDLELYDLSSDPHEKRDLATARPKLAQELRRALEHHLRRDVLGWAAARASGPPLR